jgi:hypothetical protein
MRGTSPRKGERLVAVTVTLLIPMSRCDVKNAAAGREMARDIVRELPVEVGGVRVKVVC